MEQTKALVSITFIGSASPYHEGDVAGFPSAEARQYVDKGVAEYTDEDAAKAAVAPPPPVAPAGGRVKGGAAKPAKAPAAKPGAESTQPAGDGAPAGSGDPAGGEGSGTDASK